MRRILTLLALVCLCTGATGSQRLKVGLVLGGGGAKGAAEVGVLKSIEEAGIPIDYIAGTSIGSIIGGLYANGYRAATLDSLFRSQEWLDLLGDRKQRHRAKPIAKEEGVTYVFGYPVSRKKKHDNTSGPGVFHGDNIMEFLDSLIEFCDSTNFDSLAIPFRCVATDAKSRTEVVLDRGKLSQAMRASMAIPGAYKPVAIGPYVLYDGGLLNNLPVDVALEMGADVVIAIDLTQNKHETRDFDLREATGIGGLLNWVVSRPDLKKYNENVKRADVYINPQLKGYSATSFNGDKITEMIAIGEAAGKARLKTLKKLRKLIYKGVKPQHPL